MDFQKRSELPSIPAEQAAEEFSKRFGRLFSADPEKPHQFAATDLNYHAWPQAFPSTSGPFRGIGGQAVSAFTMEAWEAEGVAVIYCKGRFVAATQRFGLSVEWKDKPK